MHLPILSILVVLKVTGKIGDFQAKTVLITSMLMVKNYMFRNQSMTLLSEKIGVSRKNMNLELNASSRLKKAIQQYAENHVLNVLITVQNA